jgi:hypothetical protein
VVALALACISIVPDVLKQIESMLLMPPSSVVTAGTRVLKSTEFPDPGTPEGLQSPDVFQLVPALKVFVVGAAWAFAGQNSQAKARQADTNPPKANG